MSGSNTGGSLLEGANGSVVRRRRSYTAKFKAEVVIEALRGRRSLVEIAREYGLPKETLALWKNELEARLPVIFDDFMLRHHKTRREAELEHEVANLRLRLKWARVRKKKGIL